MKEITKKEAYEMYRKACIASPSVGMKVLRDLSHSMGHTDENETLEWLGIDRETILALYERTALSLREMLSPDPQDY